MTGTVQDPGVPSVMRIVLEGQIYLPLEKIAFILPSGAIIYLGVVAQGTIPSVRSDPWAAC